MKYQGNIAPRKDGVHDQVQRKVEDKNRRARHFPILDHPLAPYSSPPPKYSWELNILCITYKYTADAGDSSYTLKYSDTIHSNMTL
jgi:hypothetical protein